MALKYQPILAADEIFTGTDKTLQFQVTTGDKIVVSADMAVAATTVSVKALTEAIANDSNIRFSKNGKVNLDAAGSVGNTTLTLAATTIALFIGDVGYVIQDITGWTFDFVIKRYANSPDAILTLTPSIAVAADGTVNVALIDTDTTGFVADETYFYTLRRSNAGSEDVLAYGEFVFKKPTVG